MLQDLTEKLKAKAETAKEAYTIARIGWVIGCLSNHYLNGEDDATASLRKEAQREAIQEAQNVANLWGFIAWECIHVIFYNASAQLYGDDKATTLTVEALHKFQDIAPTGRKN